MHDNDIAQAMEIDREAFPTQWPHPTYGSFKRELRNRLARYIVVTHKNESTSNEAWRDFDNKTFRQKVLQLRHLFDHDRFFGAEPPPMEYVLGIAGFWMMVDEAHITTIAVREAYRRQGIGEWMLTSLVDMAMGLKAKMVTLEVRVSNKEAQALYLKYGFQPVGTRRAYYSDNGEDAVIMSTDTITSADFQSRFQQMKQVHRQRWIKLYPEP